jgi:hypothetical protein
VNRTPLRKAINQKYTVMLNDEKVISEFIDNRLLKAILESKIMMQILMFHLKISE